MTALPVKMDALRVKHVINEVAAELTRQLALPENATALSMQPSTVDAAHRVRKFCRELAALLMVGPVAYDHFKISVENYYSLRSSADLIDHAIQGLAYGWNDIMRATQVPAAQVILNASALSAFVANRWEDYEVYFREHPKKVVAYASKYTTIDAIVDAKVDVEAMGEPYEVTPFPLSNGRIGCGYCNKTMADMEVLMSHHQAIHQSRFMEACTECTWTSQWRFAGLVFHQQMVHDIYEAGDPNSFSTNLDHLGGKDDTLLKRLLVEDRNTLATLRNCQPPPARVPAEWGWRTIANAIIRVRTEIKTIPGWQEVVDRKRTKRIAQYLD